MLLTGVFGIRERKMEREWATQCSSDQTALIKEKYVLALVLLQRSAANGLDSRRSITSHT